jgi:sec-independent protein translocase protein TatB
MFDIGWQELFIVAVLIVVVVGPKDLPRTLRAIMGWIRKARSMAREFQDGVDDVVRQADLEDIKNQVSEVGDLELGKEFTDSLDLSDDLDVGAIKSDVEDALSVEPPAATGEKPEKKKPAQKKPTIAGAAKDPRRGAKARGRKKPAPPARGRTLKKSSAKGPTPKMSPAKVRTRKKGVTAAAKAVPTKAKASPAKAGKAARPKKPAGRPSRAARAPAKTGA